MAATRLVGALRSLIEPLEARRMLSAIPPQIVLNQATTLDDKSVTVSYSIGTAAVTQALKFNFYRSDQPVMDAGSTLIRTQTLPATDTTDLAVGAHKLALISGTTLTPNTAQQYIVAVANPDGSIIEAAGSNNVTYFHTFMLGAIAHGAEFTGTTIPDWEASMATDLVTKDHYNDAIALNWVTASRAAKSGQAVAAGNNLYSLVVARADQLAAGHAGDVVDLHFIGHSRGGAVISQAMQRLVGITDPALVGSYIKATFVDSHPANAASVGLYSGGSAVSALAMTLFQLATKDPQVIIPANVKYAEVYYQHTTYKNFITSDPLEYSTLNIWGQGPNDGIVNKSSSPIHYINLTSAVGNTVNPIGHGEMPYWYLLNVIDTGAAANVA